MSRRAEILACDAQSNTIKRSYWFSVADYQYDTKNRFKMQILKTKIWLYFCYHGNNSNKYLWLNWICDVDDSERIAYKARMQ